MYDFDEIIDRHGTGTEKYSDLKLMFGTEDVLPLWVADMDFRTPDFVYDAIRRRMEHPILSYTAIPDDYFPTISRWIQWLHGWEVDAGDIRYMPGLVKAQAFVLNYFLNKGDRIIIQPPVYHRFAQIPRTNGFETVSNPLLRIEDEDGFLDHYEMNFDELERLIDKRTKLLILCNPHNPSGRAWDRATLERLAEIVTRHDLLVLSDEINAETVFYGKRHIPFASVSPEAAARTITMMAPSKTFNIAGIVSSYIIIQNPALRDKFFQWLDENSFDLPSIFAIEATMACYTKGKAWREEVLHYIEENIDYVDARIRAELPRIRGVRPQASPTIWLDCTKLGYTQPELMHNLLYEAKVAFNDGTQFGPEGAGYLRMNIAGPRAVLGEAIELLKASGKF
jgi:cystathionine beta-lyase